MEKRIPMTERERLIEIFKTTKYKAYECTPETTVANQFSEYALSHIVDEFLKKGIMVPPCKVGDTIYVIPSRAYWRINNMYESMKPLNRIYEQTVDEIHIYQSGYTVSSCEGVQHLPSVLFGETWFLTREEAEKALKEREENA